jgi:hypothetical protein
LTTSPLPKGEGKKNDFLRTNQLFFVFNACGSIFLGETMNQLKTVVFLSFAVIVLPSGFVLADTVFLKDGREIEGTIIQETTAAVIVRMPNGTVRTILKRQVDAVIYDAPKYVVRLEPVKPTPAPAPTPATDDEAAKPETGGSEADKTEGKKEASPLEGFPKGAKRLEEEKESQLLSLMKKIADDNSVEREQASGAIAAFGIESAPYLAAGMYDASVYARTECAALLGNLAAQNAAKQMLEVFYAVMPDAGGAATYQVPFLRALRAALPKVTGQSFINVEPSSALMQEGLNKYVEWYNQNIETLPEQLGEPELDRTAADYMEQLKKARALELKKRQWPAPPSASDLAAGKKDLPEGAGEREADKEFARSVDKVDRETGGGEFREKDRESVGDFFR